MLLYLNRCVDDCPVAVGEDDARTDSSSVVEAGTLTALPRLDLAWADVVLCAGEVLAPYDVQIVTDEEPAAGEAYVEIMIAGLPEELGLAPGTRGVAPHADDCAPIEHGLAIVFGNVYDLVAEPERAQDLCLTAMHELGHLLGLEHVADCVDLMSDDAGCAGRPWFHDLDAAATDRVCGPETQNSHDRVLAVLGAGGGRPPPHVEIVDTDGGITAAITEGRPLDRVELAVDGVVVATAAPATSVTFAVTAQAEHEIRAYDDLGRIGSDRAVAGPTGSCSAGGDAPYSVALVLLCALTSLRTRRHITSRSVG